MGPLAHAGLALATALSAMVNMGLLVMLLAGRLKALDWRPILHSHLRVILASTPIVAACLWIGSLAVWSQPDAWVAKSVMLVVGIGLSVAGYVTMHTVLGSSEMEFLWGLVKRKIGRP
jgi:putative peptidoglycan lipid II flippase